MNNPAPSDDFDRLVEPHRDYLHRLSDGLDARLRSKFDPEDVVQETMLRAHKNFHTLREPEEPHVARAWLKTILTHYLIELHEKFTTDKRNIELERSITADVDQSAAGMESSLTSGDTTPSRAAMRNERSSRMMNVLSGLPERQREVVVKFYFNRVSIQEIARLMDCTPAAAGGLLQRGLASLREFLT